MKKLFVLYALFFAYDVISQDNVARLTTIIGSHIEFNFNSLDDYNDGIRIDDGTTLAITMSEIAPAVLIGWHLDMQTFLGETSIDGNGTNSLPLDVIQIEATDANGNLATANFTGLQDLTVAPGVTLMSTTDPLHLPANPNTHQVNLSYECGMANGSLLGQVADYYTVNVEIILIPDF
jgi:hypothetical protein